MSLAAIAQPLFVAAFAPEAAASHSQAAQQASRETRLGYDGAETSKRRASVSARLISEDDELTSEKRRRLVAGSRDIQRNFEIAAWAIRKHLDFVSSFSFASQNAESVPAPATPQATPAPPAESQPEPQRASDPPAGETGREFAERSQLDDDIEGIIREASQPENCDVAARHSLAAMLRLAEARATIDGDLFLMELADGRTQAIEGDRIRDPAATNTRDESGRKVLSHGVRTDAAGRALEYAVHHRTAGGFQFERWVPAANMMQRAYFERFDQVRGISPFSPALNRLRDLYESFDYALAKAKISQLFGFKFTRNGNDATGNVDNDGTDDRPSYSIDPGKGPWMLDLEPGDDAAIMESATPSGQFQDYTQLMIAVALLALDLPWNFFKVDATNFFGSRAALNLYLQSVKPKRAANLAILHRWTRRQLQLAILRGRLRLPRSMTLDSLRFNWTPDGLPWWNPSQEADGALKAIGAGLDNPQRICLETGTNLFENIDRIAEAKRYAASKGVDLSFALPPSLNFQPSV